MKRKVITAAAVVFLLVILLAGHQIWKPKRGLAGTMENVLRDISSAEDGSLDGWTIDIARVEIVKGTCLRMKWRKCWSLKSRSVDVEMRNYPSLAADFLGLQAVMRWNGLLGTRRQTEPSGALHPDRAVCYIEVDDAQGNTHPFAEVHISYLGGLTHLERMTYTQAK